MDYDVCSNAFNERLKDLEKFAEIKYTGTGTPYKHTVFQMIFTYLPVQQVN